MPDGVADPARSIAPRPSWTLLISLSAALVAMHLATTHATAWHFFHDAARLLVGDGAPGGLHLYAGHPDFQFGPLSIVVALPFTVLGESAGAAAAIVASSAMGVAAFWCVIRALDAWGVAVSRRALNAAGVLFVLVWSDVAARTTHIDDALALTAGAYAVAAAATGRGWIAAAAVGIAAAAKPWALAFAPVALAGCSRREAAARAVTIVGIVGATWAPFVLVEPDTLDVTRFAIENDPTSALRGLGVDTAETPAWTRTAQLAGGTAAAALVVRRGRVHAAMLAAVGVRLLVEPGAHRYYTAGAVLGALLVELVARPQRPPWCTATLAAALELTALPGSAVVVRRVVRLLVVVAALIAAASVSPRRAVSPARERWPGPARAWSSSTDP